MHRSALPSILPLFLLLCAALGGGAQEIPHFSDDVAPEVLAQSLVNAMSNQEALGQTLMFGYPGQAPDPLILKRIQEQGLGGVKIFGWNATDLEILAETVGRYQRESASTRFGIPLLVATDQEGGWVRHVKGESSITPGNMAIGADGLPYDAWKTGEIIGKELAAVGVNMNFAPTVDVFVDPRADVIGPRAFMADPGQTGILGLSFAKGHEVSGVIGTAKHFPGHGDTSEDSHGTLPTVNAPLSLLRERDLIPYRTLIAGGIPAIMVGHLAFPEITGNRVPATLSPVLLETLLRDELGFEGVAITDDLFMTGARSDGSPLDEVCYRAMAAGADLLLVSQGPNDHQAINSTLLERMKDDEAFNARVRQAATRVVTMKARYIKGKNAVPLEPETEEMAIPANDAPSFFLEQAARSITAVKSKRLPLPPEEAGKVLLAGFYPEFFTAGLERYEEAKTWKLTYQSDVASYQQRGRELLRAAQNYDSVIVLLPDEDMAILLEELEPIAQKVIVLSVLSPAHLDALGWVQTSLAAYGTGEESFKAAFAALAGDFTPQGTLPIPLKSAP